MANLQLDHSRHRPARHALALRYLVHDFEVAMNVGSVFRIGDALGVEMIHLTGRSAVPPNRKLRRTSRGTEQHVPFRHDAEPLPVLRELKADGYRIVCLELTSASIDIRELPVAPADRLCLVLGSENRGVSQALLDASDHTVHIPMLGVHSSMNVATACAIVSFEITRAFALPLA
jgi:tRNA G18 (ribose-2'-O)-methylase SpoU